MYYSFLLVFTLFTRKQVVWFSNREITWHDANLKDEKSRKERNKLENEEISSGW